MQVSLKTADKDAATSRFEVHVSGSTPSRDQHWQRPCAVHETSGPAVHPSGDTVSSVKEKVAASQLIAFPEHALMFKGKKMDEAGRPFRVYVTFCILI